MTDEKDKICDLQNRIHVLQSELAEYKYRFQRLMSGRATCDGCYSRGERLAYSLDELMEEITINEK